MSRMHYKTALSIFLKNKLHILCYIHFNVSETQFCIVLFLISSNLGSRKESLPSINNQNAGNTEISVVGPFDKMWKQEAGSRRESLSVSDMKGYELIPFKCSK